MIVLLLLVGLVPASAGSSSGISGIAFQDLNGDGLRQPGEPPFPDHVVYLYDDTGNVIATRTTDAEGRYSFAMTAGTYRVAYMPSTWRSIWSDWVPTNTADLVPEHVGLVPGDVADFAWRPIVKSTTVSSPISEFTGPSGLRVQAYNDVIDARTIHDHVTQHFLVTEEAAATIIRFAYGAANSNVTSVSRSGGEVTRVTSISYSSYERWLSGGDRTMAHEYGHAWTNFHMYMRWDDGWNAYLTARGIDPDDTRLGSSHAWHPGEIAAEDYRQLFTAATSSGQMNTSIPRPWDVDGFEEWMRTIFTGGLTATEPEPTPPAEDSSAEPETDAGSDLETEPVEEPDSAGGPTEPEQETELEQTSGTGASNEAKSDPEDESGTSSEPELAPPTGETSVVPLAVTPRKVRGLNHADLTWLSEGPVEVLVDGTHLTTTTSRSFTHATGLRGHPSLTYQVCQAGTCSEPVTVSSW